MGTRTTTGNGLEFTQTGTASRLTVDQLEDCHQPGEYRRSDGDVICYAVARINGAVQYRSNGDLITKDGCTVLYVSPEGEAAVRRNFAAAPGEWNRIDAYSFTDPDSAEAKVCDPETFQFIKPVLDAHPYLD